jgi:hypothetical protein
VEKYLKILLGTEALYSLSLSAVSAIVEPTKKLTKMLRSKRGK